MISEHISLLFTSIICVISVPLIAYHGYNYFLNRYHIVFRKRYAFITIYEVILALIKFTIDGVCYFLEWKWNANLSIASFSIIPDLFLCIGNVCWMLIMFCWIIRFFLLAFDLNFTHVVLNHKWQKIINPKSARNDTQLDWYLNNKSKLSNAKWVAIIFSPWVVAAVICSLFETQLFSKWFNYSDNTFDAFQYIATVLCFIPYVILFFIYFKIGKIKDNFYIHGELKRMFIIFTAWVIGYGMQIIFAVICNFESTAIHALLGIAYAVTLLSDSCQIMVSTYWVNSKVSYLMKPNKTNIISRSTSADFSYNYLGINYSMITDIDQHSTNTSNNEKKPLNTTRELLQTIFNEKMFENFVDYVTKDLIINQLLGFIELVQFEKYVANIIKNQNQNQNNKLQLENIDDNKKGFYRNINFYPNITHSYIVYEYLAPNIDIDDNSYLLRCKAHLLFLKYIEYGSNYEIDINTDTRISIINEMEHKHEFLDEYSGNCYDILHIFDDVIEELFQTLVNSFIRYKKTKQYREEIKVAKFKHNNDKPDVSVN